MDTNKLGSMVQEGVNSMYREQAEKELRADIAEKAMKEFGKEEMPKKKFNTLVKFAYDLSVTDKINELQEISDTLDQLDIS